MHAPLRLCPPALSSSPHQTLVTLVMISAFCRRLPIQTSQFLPLLRPCLPPSPSPNCQSGQCCSFALRGLDGPGSRELVRIGFPRESTNPAVAQTYSAAR